MAQEFITLQDSNPVGVIALNKSAFQTIMKNAIDEEDNLKIAESASPFKYAVSCKIANDQLVLSADVKVKYTANVNQVCANVQGKIFENIEHMTGYKPDVIDIRVVGFIF